MADYAIGLSFHKAHRTLVRAVELTPPRRYFATRNSTGFITLPELDPGQGYVEMHAITQSSFQITDNDQEFRILGDDGWADSVITGSRVQASNTAYFMKDTQLDADNVPLFRGNYDEGFALIEKCRYNKDFEIYVEFLKEIGQAEGQTGNWIYDFTGFNCVLTNFNEQKSAEGLTEITFDMMSRGRPVFGRYDAGSVPLQFGGIQSNLLFLEPGVRQVATVPQSDASAVAVGADLTLTYTSDGTAPLTQLDLGSGGFTLQALSSGISVPVDVTINANVVTINPVSDLASGVIYKLTVGDGAVTQRVDGTGSPSAAGIRRPIQGLSLSFRTA